MEGFDYNTKEGGTEEDRRTNRKLEAEAYYNGISYLDEVGVDCQTAIITTLSPEYWAELG